MFAIEKNIPVPTTGKGRPDKYPWKNMEVGDSFLVPDSTSAMFVGRKQYAQRAHNARYVTRREADGLRVWRVE